MASNKDRIWLLKAHALLFPTPFAAIDPDGEEDRAKAVRERLKDSLKYYEGPVDVNEDECEQLEICSRDAFDSHVLLPDEGGNSPDEPRQRSEGFFGMLNPFDGKNEAKDQLSAARIGELHGELLAAIPEKEKDSALANWYCNLWWALRDWFHKPGENPLPLPGSLDFPDHSVWSHRNVAAALAGARAEGGQPALLYLHVGPVQGFVKASRRTHDLWVSSFTVAYLTFQAVREVVEMSGPDALIYPDLAALPLAQLCQPGLKDNVHKSNRVRPCLPNRFVAIVKADEAQTVAQAASEAVVATFKEMAQAVKDGLERHVQTALEQFPGKNNEKTWELFDAQIQDFVEFDALSQPWPKTRDALQKLLENMLPKEENPLRTGVEGDRIGEGYGQLFNLTHRVLSAHRRTIVAEPLAGRKRPKCAQCGEREQLGPYDHKPDLKKFWGRLSRAIQCGKNNKQPGPQRQRLSIQLKEGEGLCAVCLTKRFAPEFFYGTDRAELGLNWGKKGSPNDRHLLRFPSVASVASAPWRRLLVNHQSEPKVENWMTALEDIHGSANLDWDPPLNQLPGLGKLGKMYPKRKEHSLLDFDGVWFYRRSYELGTLWRDFFGRSPPGDGSVNKLQGNLKKARGLFKTVTDLVDAKPTPYFAVLVMDGDHMGHWLTGRHERTPTVKEVYQGIRRLDPDWENQNWATKRRPLFPALHSEFSRRLGRLAVKEIPRIVEEVYLGRLVYSGGDDVLALLPVQTVLPCAWALYRSFQQPEYLGGRVTASAGITMCHMMEPLSRAIEEARRAEQTAKDAGRDRFSVKVMKRSGAPLEVTLPWRLASSKSRASFKTVEALLALTEPVESQDHDDVNRQPLTNPNVAYRLEQEVAVLDPRTFEATPDPSTPQRDRDEELSGPLRAAFKSRLASLLGKQHPFLEALLDNNALRPRQIVDLLLIARFLLREEHGIETWSMIQALEKTNKEGQR